MSPGSSTDSYPAFAHIGLRENSGKNVNQYVIHTTPSGGLNTYILLTHEYRLLQKKQYSASIPQMRLYSVEEIRDSEMVFGEMRPRIRYKIPGIHLMVEENLGKTKPDRKVNRVQTLLLLYKTFVRDRAYLLVFRTEPIREVYNLEAEKLPSKYGVHSEEYVTIRTGRSDVGPNRKSKENWEENLKAFHNSSSRLPDVAFPTLTSESPSFTTIQNNRMRLSLKKAAKQYNVVCCDKNPSLRITAYMVYSSYSGFPNGALHLFVNRISEDALLVFLNYLSAISRGRKYARKQELHSKLQQKYQRTEIFRTTRADLEDHKWPADYSLRNAELHLYDTKTLITPVMLCHKQSKSVEVRRKILCVKPLIFRVHSPDATRMRRFRKTKALEKKCELELIVE
ncbi:hypothetical protein ANN_22941 [Periplaneta americana]|uniref:Uncharacterized protein n=1 Tax=Periplaneta americana TaxID=6978 RepID=A0ABQ8SJT7_PERAM|nr:hypothetical protein ANN_22941 [Periplaneta americana]